MARWTRRDALAALVGGMTGTVGCLDTEDETAPLARPSPPPDVDPPRPAVTVAHWLPDDPDNVTPPGVSVSFERHPDRVRHEAAIADVLREGIPPEVFQTVLGPELARYETVAAISPLPDDLLETSALLRPELERLVTVEDRCYAVPIALVPMDTMGVRPDAFEVRVDDRTIDTPEIFLEMLREGNERWFGLRDDGMTYLRLIGLCLLGLEGIAAYEAMATGEIHLEPLRAAIDLAAEWIEHARVLESPISAEGLTSCDAVLGIPEVDAGTEWQRYSFPGTGDVAVVDVVGFAMTARGSAPAAAERVLAALAETTVQAEVADLAGGVPALVGDDRAGLAPELERVREATAVLPALSTGCGMDVNRRWRAIAYLDGADWRDPGSIGDRLGEILR